MLLGNGKTSHAGYLKEVWDPALKGWDSLNGQGLQLIVAAALRITSPHHSTPPGRTLAALDCSGH